MKLVLNTFAPILFELAEDCYPDDIFNLRDVILKPVRKLDIRVAQDCREVVETVTALVAGCLPLGGLPRHRPGQSDHCSCASRDGEGEGKKGE